MISEKKKEKKIILMETVQIPLRNRKKEIVAYATIDKINQERVSALKWHLSNGYAFSSYVDVTGKQQHMSMHRFIMNATHDQPAIDHIDCKRLNNCMNNLRFATASLNRQNHEKRSGGSSKYIGVSFETSHEAKPWGVRCGKKKIRDICG